MRKFLIKNNRFNVNNNNDDNDDIDDDHYYDSDQYNRFYPSTIDGERNNQLQSNTQNNDRMYNTNYNNNYQNSSSYNSNPQNNTIKNYQYYSYNTQWKENQEQQRKVLQQSISTSVLGMVNSTNAIIGKENSKIIKKRNSINNLPPSYQELNHHLNPHHQQEQQQQQHQHHQQGRFNSYENNSNFINWKNNTNIFGNLSLLNVPNDNDIDNTDDGDVNIERPINNNHHNSNQRILLQNRNQHYNFQQQKQQQQQQQQQLNYEVAKPKLFGRLSLQKKNIIDPNGNIDIDNTSNSQYNNDSNKNRTTLITGLKNSKIFKNSTPKTKQNTTTTTTTIRNNRNNINQNYNTDYNQYIDNDNDYNNENHNENAYNDNDVDDDDDDVEIDNDNDDNRVDGNKIKKKININTKIRLFIIEFLEEVSAHGFVYLAKGGLHILERIIWILFIAVAIFGVISLGQRIWERFQSSPMVITMDRNKLVWNTSFPSLTVCPYKRIDESKVEEYIENHPKSFQTDDDREVFRQFVTNLASASYDNIEKLVINHTFGIKSDKYRDLLHELQWNFAPEMSSGTPVKMHIYETVTELGVCHSVNSMIARYNSYEYWKFNKWSPLDHGDKVTVHPLDGEIYAQIINLSTAYDVYFHGAMEVPDISKQKYTFPETDYTTVELTALEIFTAEEAKDFSIKQRKCRFHYEAKEMMTSPIYTFGLCRTECRMKLSLKICKCVPHFYRNHVRSGQILPICGIDGFACLAKIKKEIISLKSDNIKIECDCQPNCDDSNFFVQSYKSRIWFLGANLQWGISSYPKMQLRREILFTFADVLVYIGGLAGFFLGCSILSFTEFIYFFTARLFKRLVLD